jgi:CRISPR-associated protein Cas5d
MMQKKIYEISFEIAGPAAMFSRPDTGSVPISYPAPTKSALKSIFESIAYSEKAYFVPQQVEICAPVVYHKYTTNYKGPLKKAGTENFQFFATVLENVCYKVYGIIEAYTPPRTGDNPQHQLQAVFLRRLRSGLLHSTPFLGWKEFVPTYFGPLREETVPEKSINLVIPSLLDEMYDKPTRGKVDPSFKQDVQITEGILKYA